MIWDKRIQRARAKAGLTGSFGYEFECPVCGGLADVRHAMAARDSLVVDVLELPLNQWDPFDDEVLKSSQPVRAATLQRISRQSLDDANSVLMMAEELLLLAEEGDGYGPAKLICQPCYRQALDDLLEGLADEGKTITKSYESTARAAE